MSRTSRPRRLSAGLAAAALVLTSLGAATAHAAPSAEPVPGPLMNYVVNTKATPGHVRKTEDAVKAAGGTVLVSYRQLGVVIAQSTNPDFKTAVRSSVTCSPSVRLGRPRSAKAPAG